LAPREDVIARLKQELDDPLNHRYPNYVGDKSLRQAIANYYHIRFGVQLNPDSEILPLVGSKEGLINATLAFLNPGEKVLVPNPAYPAYNAGAYIASGDLVEYQLREENGFLPDLAEIDKLDLAGVKLWWLSYPNNPTGAIASKEDLAVYLEYAKVHNLYILYDNPYADVYFGTTRPPSILEVEGAKDRVIEFNSLSKTYNLAGWRIGMAISSKENIASFTQLKSNVDTGIFTALQKAAAYAIESTDADWIKERNSIYRERRDILATALKKLGFEFSIPEAALYMWVKHKDLQADVEQKSLEIMQETQVFITPGTAYGSAGKGYFRISLCQPKENLAEAMKRLEAYFA
jgi:aspartate/methionine/tyrosine aminotransferase